MQSQYLDVIKQMLSASLQPDEQYFVRVQAVKALGSFVSMHDKEVAIQKHFGDLLPNFMQVIFLFLSLSYCAYLILRLYKSLSFL